MKDGSFQHALVVLRTSIIPKPAPRSSRPPSRSTHPKESSTSSTNKTHRGQHHQRLITHRCRRSQGRRGAFALRFALKDCQAHSTVESREICLYLFSLISLFIVRIVRAWIEVRDMSVHLAIHEEDLSRYLIVVSPNDVDRFLFVCFSDWSIV